MLSQEDGGFPRWGFWLLEGEQADVQAHPEKLAVLAGPALWIRHPTRTLGTWEGPVPLLVDLNTAEIEHLSLPGVPAAAAQKALASRRRDGNFKSVADFAQHAGLNAGQRKALERMAAAKVAGAYSRSQSGQLALHRRCSPMPAGTPKVLAKLTHGLVQYILGSVRPDWAKTRTCVSRAVYKFGAKVYFDPVLLRENLKRTMFHFVGPTFRRCSTEPNHCIFERQRPPEADRPDTVVLLDRAGPVIAQDDQWPRQGCSRTDSATR